MSIFTRFSGEQINVKHINNVAECKGSLRFPQEARSNN